MADDKTLENLEREVYQSDLVTQLHFTVEELKAIKYNQISKRRNSFSIFSQLDLKNPQIDPNSISFFKLIRQITAIYLTLPEFYQAINIVVDNMLSPDSISKDSLVIQIKVERGTTDYETITNLLKVAIEYFDIENLLEKLVHHFVLYGNAFIEIVPLKPILTKAKLITDKSEILVSVVQPDEPAVVNLTKPKFSREIVDYIRVLNFFKRKGIRVTKDSLSEILDGAGDLSFDQLDNLQLIDLQVLDPAKVLPLYKGNTFLGLLVVETAEQENKKAIGPLSQLSVNEKNIQRISNELAKQLLQNSEQLRKLVQSSEELAILIGSLLRQLQLEKEMQINSIRYIPPILSVHFKNEGSIFTYFGQPYALGVLHIASYLIAIEAAQVIYRLTRAPEKRVFRVNTFDDPRASAFIQEIINRTKKKEYALQSGSLEALVNEITMFEDYFIPTTRGTPAVEVETLPGGEMSARMEDVEYFRKKLISGLGIPAIYLIQEESSESKYTLSQENVKFARTIVRLQKAFGRGLNELLYKLFDLVFGVADWDTLFEIQLRPPIAIMMEREQEIFQNFSGFVQALRETASNLIDVDQVVLKKLESLLDQVPLKSESLESLAKTKLKGSSGETGGTTL